MFLKGKSGASFLVENVVFIILNVVFLSIVILFLMNQSSSGRVLEESYAKEIALIADYAKPEMLIKIDMREGFEISEKEGINFENVVNVEDNVVFVKLSEDGGYSYSFFNDVNLRAYPETDNFNEYTGFYILTITEKDSVAGGENE